MKYLKKYEKHELDDPYGEEEWEDEPYSPPYEYDTNLTIGPPVVRAGHKNEYKIIVSNMHGDADSYTRNVVYTADENYAKKIIDFCRWANDSWTRRENIRKVGDKVFGSYDYVSEFVDSDATADRQFPCRPSIERVTYFDNDGVECVVRINQKKVK